MRAELYFGRMVEIRAGTSTTADLKHKKRKKLNGKSTHRPDLKESKERGP